MKHFIYHFKFEKCLTMCSLISNRALRSNENKLIRTVNQLYGLHRPSHDAQTSPNIKFR